MEQGELSAIGANQYLPVSYRVWNWSQRFSTMNAINPHYAWLFAYPLWRKQKIYHVQGWRVRILVAELNIPL